MTHQAFTRALRTWLDAYVAGVLAELRPAVAARVEADLGGGAMVPAARRGPSRGTRQLDPANRTQRAIALVAEGTPVRRAARDVGISHGGLRAGIKRAVERGDIAPAVTISADAVVAAGPFAPPLDITLSGSPATASAPSPTCGICRAPHRPQPPRVSPVAPVVRSTWDTRAMRAREVADR